MRTSRLLACLAAALLGTACSRDPKPGTPEAVALGDRFMRSMSDLLAHAGTFAFDTVERVELPATGGQKRVLTFTRKATVRRPDALFFEIHGTGGTALEDAAWYDGRTATLSDGAGKVWAQTEVPSTLDEMLDDVARRFGLPVPIADVVYSSPYDAFIGKETKGGFVGRETIDGVPCVKLDYDDSFVGVRLWLPASGQPLPRRLEIVHKKAPGQPVAHMDFTSWTLGVPVADATFAFQPPEGYSQVAFADFVAGLTSGAIPSRREAAQNERVE